MESYLYVDISKIIIEVCVQNAQNFWFKNDMQKSVFRFYFIIIDLHLRSIYSILVFLSLRNLIVFTWSKHYLVNMLIPSVSKERIIDHAIFNWRLRETLIVRVKEQSLASDFIHSIFLPWSQELDLEVSVHTFQFFVVLIDIVFIVLVSRLAP